MSAQAASAAETVAAMAAVTTAADVAALIRADAASRRALARGDAPGPAAPLVRCVPQTGRWTAGGSQAPATLPVDKWEPLPFPTLCTGETKWKLHPEGFCQRFADDSPALASLDLSGFLLAGGACGALATVSFDGSRWKPGWRVNDYDLFVVGAATDLEADDRLSSLAERLVAHPCVRVVNAIRTANALTIRYIELENSRGDSPLHGTTTVQIIFRRYPSAASVLYGFDLPCASLGYLFAPRDRPGAGLLVATPLGYLAYASHACVLDPSRFSTTFEARVLRYLRRGFAMMAPEFDPVRTVLPPAECPWWARSDSRRPWGRFGPLLVGEYSTRGLLIVCDTVSNLNASPARSDYDGPCPDLLRHCKGTCSKNVIRLALRLPLVYTFGRRTGIGNARAIALVPSGAFRSRAGTDGHYAGYTASAGLERLESEVLALVHRAVTGNVKGDLLRTLGVSADEYAAISREAFERGTPAPSPTGAASAAAGAAAARLLARLAEIDHNAITWCSVNPGGQHDLLCGSFEPRVMTAETWFDGRAVSLDTAVARAEIREAHALRSATGVALGAKRAHDLEAQVEVAKRNAATLPPASTRRSAPSSRLSSWRRGAKRAQCPARPMPCTPTAAAAGGAAARSPPAAAGGAVARSPSAAAAAAAGRLA
jgi:hypothetical protein